MSLIRSNFKTGGNDLAQVLAKREWFNFTDNTRSLWGWGPNTYGTLGLGYTTPRSTPSQIGADIDWQQVSTYSRCAAAIKTDGTLWVTGRNSYGQLGLNDTANRSSLTQVSTDDDWELVTIGNNHMMIIKSSGSLWATGGATFGDGASVLGLSDNVQRSTATQVGTDTDWASATAGSGQTLAVKTDGTLWAWGSQNLGRLGLNSELGLINSPVQVGTDTNWARAYTKDRHSGAIKTDGSIWIWGHGIGGKLGLGDTQSRSTPVQIGTGTDWNQLSIAKYGNHAIKNNGELWTWGYGYLIPLGLGGYYGYIVNSPVQIGALTDWQNVKTGNYSTTAIKTDGTLWAWGYNIAGDLGLNNTSTYTSPVQVGSDSNWLSHDMGRSVLALRSS